jgi:hypothetical protein
MFFFEKKNQKTFPGGFAREPMAGATIPAPQALHRWNACGARAEPPSLPHAPAAQRI